MELRTLLTWLFVAFLAFTRGGSVVASAGNAHHAGGQGEPSISAQLSRVELPCTELSSSHAPLASLEGRAPLPEGDGDALAERATISVARATFTARAFVTERRGRRPDAQSHLRCSAADAAGARA